MFHFGGGNVLKYWQRLCTMSCLTVSWAELRNKFFFSSNVNIIKKNSRCSSWQNLKIRNFLSSVWIKILKSWESKQETFPKHREECDDESGGACFLLRNEDAVINREHRDSVRNSGEADEQVIIMKMRHLHYQRKDISHNNNNNICNNNNYHNNQTSVCIRLFAALLWITKDGISGERDECEFAGQLHRNKKGSLLIQRRTNSSAHEYFYHFIFNANMSNCCWCVCGAAAHKRWFSWRLKRFMYKRKRRQEPKQAELPHLISFTQGQWKLTDFYKERKIMVVF